MLKKGKPMIEIFLLATAACEFWHQVREPLMQFMNALGT